MTNTPSPLESIFFAAQRMQTPAERTAYLDEACAANAELRREVERMLDAQAEAGSFLEAPAAGLSATLERAASERPGTQIGHYKLLEPIGEGGMGSVWMAQQTEPVKRLVAIKLIKPGLDSRQVIARFEAERQALALMEHPNIARVLDAGTVGQASSLSSDSRQAGSLPHGGRPYFVMELVKGVPITRYCDEHHLTPRQRLELFVPVCQAIQHAHQKGIIHRDIKPSNVLVAMYDDKPVPKIIDFGVAKATGQQLTELTLNTGFGAVVGTLEYMSPEQAGFNQLDIDTRSDIYSLGVLLYELLAGSPPFTRKDLADVGLLEMLRVIREQEPSKPSTKLSSSDSLPSLSANRATEPAKLTRLVRGELDWIVMKALEKDRARRYETANGFAQDVERYLADEPVQACPPSTAYRLRKFARRNKAALATAGLVLFFIVLLAGVVGWGMRDRAAREQEIALESARKLARTEEGIRHALSQATKVRGELHALLAKRGGVQELLNQPARWDYLVHSAQSDLAVARRLSARAEGALDAELIQAMDKLEQALSDDDADRVLALWLEKIRMDCATVVEGKFDHGKAAEEYPRALARFAILQDDAAGVAGRIAASPIREQLIAALDDWAGVSLHLNQPAVSDKLLAAAPQAAPDPDWADQFRQLKARRDPETLAKLVDRAPAAGLSPQLLSLIGTLLHGTPRQEPWLRRAQAAHPADFWLNFDLGNALSNVNPAEAAGFYRVALAVRPTSVAVYNNLGLALYDQKRLPEAVAAYHNAIKLHPKDTRAYVNLGDALRAQQKLPEAMAAYRKAIEVDPKSALGYTALGVALYHQKKLPESIAACRQAIELNPKSANAYANLGAALYDQKMVPEAVAACRKAIELDPKFALAYYNLGVILRDQQLLPEAVAAFEKAVELNPRYANAHDNLGVALYAQKKLPEAIAAYHKAIEVDPKSALVYNRLGVALRDQKKLPEAIAAYHKAIEVDPKLADVYSNLGVALRDQRQFREAVAAYRKAIELDPKHAPAYNNLGLALRDQRNLPEAIAAFHKAIELDPKDALPYSNLGNALRDQRKLPEAVAACRKAVELDPKDALACTNLGLALWEQRKLPEAIELFQQAIELNPKSAHAYNGLGLALAAQGKLPEAVAAHRKGVELDPEYAPAYNALGAALHQQRKWPEAISAYHKAIELDPEFALHHSNLGLALRAQGDLSGAAAAYRKALDLNPKDADLRSQFGDCLGELRNYPAAIDVLHQGVELNPEDPWLRYRLAGAHLAAGRHDAHARVCADLLKRRGQTKHPNVAARILYTCLPAPVAEADGPLLLSLAELAATQKGNERLLGGALYRAGKYEAAIEPLMRGQDRAWDHLFLAMAHHQLGREREARDYLQKAVEQIENAGYPWQERAESEALRREAEALIQKADEKQPESMK